MAYIASKDWGRIRDAVRFTESMRGTSSPGQHPPQWGAPWPYGSQYAFGIYIAGDVVTVYPGSIEAGGTYYAAAETNVTITADGQYIGIALDRSTGAATITGPHNSRPVPSGDKWAGALYSFRFADGVVTSWHDHIHDIRLDAVI